MFLAFLLRVFAQCEVDTALTLHNCRPIMGNSCTVRGRQNIVSSSLMYGVTRQTVYGNHCCGGKTLSITYSECVCVCVFVPARVCVYTLIYPASNAHAPYCVVIRDLPAVPYFFALSHRRHSFRNNKKYVLKVKCVFRFSVKLLSETFSYSENNSEKYNKFILFEPTHALFLTHWGRGHLNCLNARSRGF